MEKVASPDAMVNPRSLDYFVQLAAQLPRLIQKKIG
jgi:hypothetical protein